MIDKLRPSQVLGGQNYGIVEMAKKINELIDVVNVLLQRPYIESNGLIAYNTDGPATKVYDEDAP